MARVLIKAVPFKLTVYAPYVYLQNSLATVSKPNHIALKEALADFANLDSKQLIYGGASVVTGSVGSQSGNHASFSSTSALTPLYTLIPMGSPEKIAMKQATRPNEFYLQAIGHGSTAADRALSAIAAVTNMTAPYVNALVMKPLSKLGDMYPNIANSDHFVIPHSHYKDTEIDVEGIEYRGQLADADRQRLLNRINNNLFRKLKSAVNVRLGDYSPGETTKRTIKIEGMATTVDETLVLYLILDTRTSRFTYEMAPKNLDGSAAKAVEFKNKMNDNLYSLALLWNDCLLTQDDITAARIDMPELDNGSYKPQLEIDYARYQETLDAFETNLPQQCDPAKHQDAADAADQTLEEYTGALAAKHKAADTVTDPSWVDKAIGLVGGAASAIGGYLSKWSPLEYVGAGAAGLVVKEAADRKWLLPLAIAAGALLILK